MTDRINRTEPTYDLPEGAAILPMGDDDGVHGVGVPDPSVNRSQMSLQQVVDELARDPKHGWRFTESEGAVVCSTAAQHTNSKIKILKRQKPPAKPKRGKRSRSRQCRGKRRRNMLRATERSLEAKTGEQEVQTITREAQILGAILTPEPKP